MDKRAKEAEKSTAMADSPSAGRRWWLGIECAVIFAGVPVILYLYRVEFSRRIIPGIAVFAVICLLLLLLDRTFDRRRLWNARAVVRHAPILLRRFLVFALPVALWTFLFERDHFLSFPRRNPKVWMMVMFFYPVLSAYPQELIFRTFFFHRYAALFPGSVTMIAASAFAFGWAHLFFANWIAVLLSTVGGVLFAVTYQRERSTLAAVVEHGLWGDFLFTVGLGWYFFGGSVRVAG